MSGKKTLLDMTENELLEGCQRTAESTEFWHDHYYREIERRTQNKHTRAMIWLTAAIGALTFVPPSQLLSAPSSEDLLA